METWMEHAILPMMSSYIVLHHDYMCTLLVVIHAIAGVATNAHAMANAWGTHYLYACALTR